MRDRGSKRLALFGGRPVRTKKFPAYNTIGKEERRAVGRVFSSGIFSRYLGAWHSHFYGGPEVRALEREWASFFKVKHAIAVNSASTGLQCAMGAIGIRRGDEVIVTPLSMSISATAPLFYGGTPIFADVEPDFFCLDPSSVRQRISKKTKAIIAVDLFGQPCDFTALRGIAKKHNLYLIEDAAQAPCARFGSKYAGTLGDIGIYSLNYHKHIHTGEGGILVTNDDRLARRLQLIRNHAEAVVSGEPMFRHDADLIGSNYRMTECTAAIARAQLKKLPALVSERVRNCSYLAKRLSRLPGIAPAPTRSGSTHAYYLQPFLFNEDVVGVPRGRFLEAVRAELSVIARRENEGVRVTGGYVRPLYLLPLFANMRKSSYRKGACMVAERLHERELFTHEYMHASATRDDLDDVIAAFTKVYEHRRELLRT
jgi:dTDP-4-amino-4,6-dideoxygalactose transaminase